MAIGKTNAGGGGSSGATLTITGVVGATVTVSKDGKTYTRTINNSGTAVFKGLSTGTWTVTMSGNGQTTTRTVEIVADYSRTIAYFSATITITYPANSTCVVTDSSGATIASDTNTGTAAKTWTATVGATGTYTITVTSADGSKTKSATVSITTDGQSESVTLTYELVLFDGSNGGDVTALTGGWDYAGHSWSSGGSFRNDTQIGIAWTGEFSSATANKVWKTWTENSIDLSGYTVLKANIISVKTGGTAGLAVKVSDSFVAKTNTTSTGIVSVSIESLSSGQVALYFTQPGGYAHVNNYIYADKIWLE